MPISSTRITPIVGANPQTVEHPADIRLVWNPYDVNDGFIQFNFRKWVEANGVNTGVEAQQTDRIHRTFAAIKNTKPGYAGLVDPVSSVALENVTMHGIFLLLQDGFDKLHAIDYP